MSLELKLFIKVENKTVKSFNMAVTKSASSITANVTQAFEVQIWKGN